jgi:hypothetical protein
MNDLSSVNSVLAPVNNSVSQTPIYEAIACAVIYAPQIETDKRITLETL